MRSTMQYSLRELRARKNLSQKQVADIVGISEFTYYRLEKNVEDLLSAKISTLDKLAKTFGVGIEEIFLG